jgi:DNA-binding MarR family transcriptional regulator
MQPEPLPELAGRLNSVSIHLVRRARTADTALGVPPGQLSALSVLVFGGERTIAELAEAEQVTSPTMTGIVHRLEKASLAERHPHPHDRRSTIVRATAKGRRTMERGRRRRVDLITGLLEQLPRDDVDAVGRAVAGLAAALEAERP